MAGLAVHDKNADDKMFLPFLDAKKERQQTSEIL